MLVNNQELVSTGLYIDTHVDRNSCKILIQKITPVCPKISKSGLGEKFREMHTSITKNILDMQEKNRSHTTPN